ncbi:hypothetical protein Fot_36099 [Forsythia ovata]|uniref:Uncharacterized protein n=1 Tax=Forsythia ovata TaxID=205694 RepID=A0ABD1SNF8_9LAMI
MGHIRNGGQMSSSYGEGENVGRQKRRKNTVGKRDGNIAMGLAPSPAMVVVGEKGGGDGEMENPRDIRNVILDNILKNMGSMEGDNDLGNLYFKEAFLSLVTKVHQVWVEMDHVDLGKSRKHWALLFANVTMRKGLTNWSWKQNKRASVHLATGGPITSNHITPMALITSTYNKLVDSSTSNPNSSVGHHIVAEIPSTNTQVCLTL